jgi:hypothetical protein
MGIACMEYLGKKYKQENESEQSVSAQEEVKEEEVNKEV